MEIRSRPLHALADALPEAGSKFRRTVGVAGDDVGASGLERRGGHVDTHFTQATSVQRRVQRMRWWKQFRISRSRQRIMDVCSWPRVLAYAAGLALGHADDLAVGVCSWTNHSAHARLPARRLSPCGVLTCLHARHVHLSLCLHAIMTRVSSISVLVRFDTLLVCSVTKHSCLIDFGRKILSIRRNPNILQCSPSQ